MTAVVRELDEGTALVAPFGDLAGVGQAPAAPENVARRRSPVASIPPASQLLDLFAPEQWCAVDSVEEARERCRTDFRYTRTSIAAAQLSLDGDLTLAVGGRRLPLTETALDGLCRFLAIPIGFAQAVPTDLLAAIVGRLRSLHEQQVVVIHREEAVVGVLDADKWCRSRAHIHRPHYQPVSNLALLGLIRPAGEFDPESVQVILADAGIRITLLSRHLEAEPEVGDVTRAGLVITASETGGPLPLARGHTLRLVCTNGATLPETFGLVRFSGDWRVDFARRLDAFAAGIGELALEQERLTAAYAGIHAALLPGPRLYDLHRQVQRIYRHLPGGIERADRALGIDRALRLQIFAEVRAWQAGYRRGSPLPAPPQMPELRAWGVFNDLTATAREDRSFLRRVALERLAGGLLEFPRAA